MGYFDETAIIISAIEKGVLETRADGERMWFRGAAERMYGTLTSR
jgi:hypothetical protein